MSAKLIMKRKLDNSQSSFNNKGEVDESVASTTPSSSNSLTNEQNKQTNKSDEDLFIQADNKRIRCDTPPPEPEDFGLPQPPQANEQNHRLLETIKLKVLELQNELDAFEHDVESQENDYYYYNRQNNQISGQDAEALGFAMCAQEALLFLQREGVPSDSLLYTRLHDALVGSSPSDRTFHLKQIRQ